jgi:hypothetical protein
LLFGTFGLIRANEADGIQAPFWSKEKADGMDSNSSEIERGRRHFMDTLQNIPEPIRAMIDYAPGYFEG